MRWCGARWLPILLLLAGCEGCGGESSRAGAEGRETTVGAAGAGSAGAEAAGGGQPGPRPEVAVRATTDRWGRLTVAVENRGAEPVRLEPEVRVGEDGARLKLSPDCAAEVEGCVTLVPGAVLYPCECGGCAELPEGEHRFHARSCGGGHRLESDPVTVDR